MVQGDYIDVRLAVVSLETEHIKKRPQWDSFLCSATLFKILPLF